MTNSHLYELDNAPTDTAPPELVPIIDFSPFTASGTSDHTRAATTAALAAAFSTSGFVYLKNHGIEQSVIDSIFSSSKNFFALPQAEKELVQWECPESNRGYVAIGKEKLSDLDKEGRAEDIKSLNQESPDLKEAFDVREDRDPDSPYKNRFPSPEFGTECMHLFHLLRDLNFKVMAALAEGLGLGPEYFDFSTRLGGNNTLRLLHYPRVQATEINDRSRRCGAHSDYGTVTFLLQDGVGGLEILDPSSQQFVQVRPIPGTLIVNIGDLLQRWTNDTLVSRMHRVVKPYTVDADGFLPARYSIAYFCDPDEEVVVETIDKFVVGEKKYAPVKAGEYLLARLSNTYF